MIILSISCKKNENTIKVGRYKGQTIYATNNDSSSIIAAVQKSLIDLESLKTRENKYYNEILEVTKQKYLFFTQFEKVAIKERAKLIKKYSYQYDIQHIFLYDLNIANELLLQSNINDFNYFAEMAKKYSKEYATADKQGVLINVNPLNNKLTPWLIANMYEKKPGTVYLLEDTFGYHLIRIISVKPFDLEKTLQTKNDSEGSIRVGTIEHVKDIYFEKMKRAYGVKKYYENYYQFLSKPENAPLYEIDGQLMRKKEYIETMDEKLKNDPYYMVQIQATTLAPKIENDIRAYIAESEARKIKVNKEITTEADKVFIEDVLQRWYEQMNLSVDMSDLEKYEMNIKKQYDSMNVKIEKTTQFALLEFSTLSELQEAAKKIKTEKDYLKYISVHQSAYSRTPDMFVDSVPEKYSFLKPYMDSPKGTILPYAKMNEKYVLPMVQVKSSQPKINYANYKGKIHNIIQQQRFYENLLNGWKANTDLQLEDWVIKQFEYFVKELKDNGINLISQNKE